MRNWRSLAVGILSLIALQVFVSGQGPDKGGQLLGWVATGLDKAISPKVAAIPTVKGAKPAAAAAAPAPTVKGGVGNLPANPTVTV